MCHLNFFWENHNRHTWEKFDVWPHTCVVGFLMKHLPSEWGWWLLWLFLFFASSNYNCDVTDLMNQLRFSIRWFQMIVLSQTHVMYLQLCARPLTTLYCTEQINKQNYGWGNKYHLPAGQTQVACGTWPRTWPLAPLSFLKWNCFTWRKYVYEA